MTIWDYSVRLEEYYRKMEYKFKITDNSPKHGSGFFQLKIIGYSIRQKWVRVHVCSCLKLIGNSRYLQPVGVPYIGIQLIEIIRK